MNDQRLNIKLVGEVEKHPVLYNFRLPGYSKKDETEKAWGEVANEVCMSVAECKERWKNLRAVFVRNMKPPKMVNGKGGADVKPKKAYYLLEAMQFTVPYIKALGSFTGSMSNPLQQEEERDEFEEDNTSQPSSFSHSPASPPLPTQKHTLPVNKRNFKDDAVDKAFIEYLQLKRSRSVSPEFLIQDIRNEGLKMFLLSMLPDLMKMSDEQVRRFKRKALDAVDDVLLGPSVMSPQPSSLCEIVLTPQSDQTDGFHTFGNSRNE